MSLQNYNHIIDCALKPPRIYYHPTDKFLRMAGCDWLAAPSIARTKGGRFYLCVNTGGTNEGPSNSIHLSYSDDDGAHFEEGVIAVTHPDEVRIHEPMVWTDPRGRVWLTWVQSYVAWDGRGGVWASIIEDADSDEPRLSEPRRLFDGVMAVCPNFTPDGRWLIPVAVWKAYRSRLYDDVDAQYSMLYTTHDEGETFELVGRADIPDRTFDENAVVQLRDGRLMMIARTKFGCGRALSRDGGQTWTPGEHYRTGPTAKSCMKMLPDGNLLWITHENGGAPERSHMAALISTDNGETWPHVLMLDERNNVSYPDVHLCDDGRIFIVHDLGRYDEREVILHIVREEDILAGHPVTPDCRLGAVVLKGTGDRIEIPEPEGTPSAAERCQLIETP